MKKAENLALAALIGLIVLAVIFLAGGIMYKPVSFWAAMLAMMGQALIVFLAWWGLRLAGQQEELNGLPPIGGPGGAPGAASPMAGFRMSYGEESTTPAKRSADHAPEVKTLETGFQRVVVSLSALLLIALSAVTIYLIYSDLSWARVNPDKKISSLDNPFDELALVIGLASAGIYGILHWITRVKRDTAGYGEAVNSNFVMGLPGMIAIGVGAVLGYLKVEYAQQIVACVVAALLLLQGLELLVNALRNYSSVEEFDQEPIDLQSLPLVPMLSSVWLSGLKLLFAQSVGLSRGETGVIGRMMPRALAAIVLIAIGMSCLRVVPTGDVALQERLGELVMTADAQGHPTPQLLAEGLHITMPWPIDELVLIPENRLEMTSVGAELEATESEGKKLDFTFWTYRHTKEGGTDNEFLTGDHATTRPADTGVEFSPEDHVSPQLLETYVGIYWRVKEPVKFYNSLSHSEFFETNEEGTTAKPIYEALIQQCAMFAVTRTYAIHNLDSIMTTGRQEVESHCREILQDKLNAANSGIEIVDLVVKDVHPPFGIGIVRDPGSPDGFKRGPAYAYENVISKREYREQMNNRAQAVKTRLINEAKGEGEAEKSRAIAYRSEQISKATGEVARLGEMLSALEGKSPADQKYLRSLYKQQMLYSSVRDLLPNINKIVVGPGIDPPQIWQNSEKSVNPNRP